MITIIFDTHITGHHSEYIEHIVKYIVSYPSDDIYYFVVHPDFPEKFEDIVIKSREVPNIHWSPITQDEVDSLANLSMIKKSFIEYKLVEKYGQKLNCDRCYLLYFNTFQLALCFRKTKFKIQGILFQQYSRMTKNSWKDKLKFYRKYYTTKLYIKNKQIEKIFILNDKNTVDHLNNTFNTSVFKVLPDPIPLLDPLNDFDIFKKYNIPKNNEIFLHFGSLAIRKGTLEIIEAAAFVPENLQQEITILLIGKAENSITEQKIRNTMSAISLKSQVQIIWENQFVSNSMMKSLFLQSDAVLMPYKNPEASSGILGHSIAAKKPVITTGKGLLKELVQKNDFGLLLDEVSPKIIAETFLKIKNLKLNDTLYGKYIDEHTSEKFSETLMNQTL